jgi:hypothetical protein
MRDTRGWKQGNGDVPAGRAESLDGFVLVCLLAASGALLFDLKGNHGKCRVQGMTFSSAAN